MPTVTGLTAARMLEIEANNIVGGAVNGSHHLILTKFDASTIDAGYVRGAQGDPGNPGAAAPAPLLSYDTNSVSHVVVATPLLTWFAATATTGIFMTFTARTSGIFFISFTGYANPATDNTLALMAFEVRTGLTFGAGSQIIAPGAEGSYVGTTAIRKSRFNYSGFFGGLTPGQDYHVRTAFYQQNANAVFTVLNCNIAVF